MRVVRRLGRWATAGFSVLLALILVVWGFSAFWHIEYRFGLNSVGVWSGQVEAEWGTLSTATSQAAEEYGWHFRTRQPDQQLLDRAGLKWPTAHLHQHVSRPWGDVAVPLWAPAAATLLGVTMSRLGRRARGWRDVAMAIGVGAAGATLGIWVASAFLHARFETGRGPVDVAIIDGTLELTSGVSGGAFSSASGPHCTWTNSGSHLVIERRDSLIAVPWGKRIGARLPESMSGTQIVRSAGSGAGGIAIPMWCIAVPATVFAMMMIRLSRGFVAPGHCRKCGYDLTANTSGVCPECGKAVVAGAAVTLPSEPRASQPPPSHELLQRP